MNAFQQDLAPLVSDRQRAERVFALAEQLLTWPGGVELDLPGLLASIATAIGAVSAGLAGLPRGEILCHQPAPKASLDYPWVTDPTLITQVASVSSGLAIRHGEDHYLLTLVTGADQSSWLLWAQDLREEFSDRDRGLFAVLGATIGRLLGQENRPRWAEAAQHQLRQRQLESAAAISSRLAHDFGNLLTGILGFTELALSHKIPSQSPLSAYLQEVHRAAQHGAAFTQQLRLFSRRQPASSRSSQLAPALAEQTVRYKTPPSSGSPVVAPSAASLRINLPSDLPPVAIDQEHLQYVLSALLDNAREAIAPSRGMPEGVVSVSARVVQLAEAECGTLFGALRPGPHVELIIADTGSGLSAEAQRRVLLEPFFSTKPRHKGFGLPVTYGILAAHRGGIRLHPGEERGVVVRVLLPVGVSGSDQEMMGRMVGRAAGHPAPNTSSSFATFESARRILVVDDEVEIVRFVVSTLEQAGYKVQAVTSGEAAFQAHVANPFHLIVSDVIMPGISGVDLVRRLVRHDPSTRVLLMSGLVPAEFTQADFAQYGVELLPKPFRPESLLRMVRQSLERSARRPEEAIVGTGTGRK